MPCTDNIHDFEKEMWLFGVVCDHVGIYDTKAAEGLSAFYVDLVNEDGNLTIAKTRKGTS